VRPTIAHRFSGHLGLRPKPLEILSQPAGELGQVPSLTVAFLLLVPVAASLDAANPASQGCNLNGAVRRTRLSGGNPETRLIRRRCSRPYPRHPWATQAPAPTKARDILPLHSMARPGKADRNALLLRALSIDPDSFSAFLEWVLCEHLVLVLSRMSEIHASFFSQPHSLRLFRDLLKKQTGRSWSEKDLEALYSRVKLSIGRHFRTEVPYEELLKLLWQIPWECARCHKKPPEVVLHVDHIVPSSVGGESKRHNLQFLCAEHNLTKSNKREFERQWLNLK
jgi:5-methylcytosine-specific restriction endonuclease McrA